MDIGGGELAKRIDRERGGTTGVELLQVAIHDHLAERDAAGVEGADIYDAVAAGRAAFGDESEVRLGEGGALEVRVDEVRAPGERVRRGELELRCEERASGGLDCHEVAVPVGESCALAVGGHLHICGAEAEGHVGRPAEEVSPSANRVPMSRSSKPSPFTSPAALTEMPTLSLSATPLSLKPVRPSREPSGTTAAKAGAMRDSRISMVGWWDGGLFSWR